MDSKGRTSGRRRAEPPVSRSCVLHSQEPGEAPHGPSDQLIALSAAKRPPRPAPLTTTVT